MSNSYVLPIVVVQLILSDDQGFDEERHEDKPLSIPRFTNLAGVGLTAAVEQDHSFGSQLIVVAVAMVLDVEATVKKLPMAMSPRPGCTVSTHPQAD